MPPPPLAVAFAAATLRRRFTHPSSLTVLLTHSPRTGRRQVEPPERLCGLLATQFQLRPLQRSHDAHRQLCVRTPSELTQRPRRARPAPSPRPRRAHTLPSPRLHQAISARLFSPTILHLFRLTRPTLGDTAHSTLACWQIAPTVASSPSPVRRRVRRLEPRGCLPPARLTPILPPRSPAMTQFFDWALTEQNMVALNYLIFTAFPQPPTYVSALLRVTSHAVPLFRSNSRPHFHYSSSHRHYSSSH